MSLGKIIFKLQIASVDFYPHSSGPGFNWKVIERRQSQEDGHRGFAGRSSGTG